MSEPFQAIYENGLLRPLGPLALEERQVVTVVIQPAGDQPAQPESSEDVIARQQAGWMAFFEEMERLPPGEPPSQRPGDLDEDALIYEDD
jgi:predicted DNA-binding antitoxin AbrB/MazE fold protein